MIFSSGDSKREVKVLCKVQAVKNILTFAMKENETIKALKKRVHAKEDIKIKEQTAVEYYYYYYYYYYYQDQGADGG